MPTRIDAELATLVSEVPAAGEWLHEIKFDGYRILARIEDGAARLQTRNGKDWSERFGPVREACAALPVRQAWLDGEVVVLDAHGVSRFQLLQGALGDDRRHRLEYFVFDLLYLDGRDLRAEPLRARKERLREVLRDLPDGSPLHYSDHMAGQGEVFYQAACERGLEGIIAKRADSRYESRRSRAWLKIKCGRRQEFVIVGYTDPRGSRTGFGALFLGYYDDQGDLRFAGKVGTGFDQEMLDTLAPRLRRLERQSAPVTDPPGGREGREAHWITPRLVGEVQFTEWTSQGLLRHPAFMGLREDKRPADVVREQPAPSSRPQTTPMEELRAMAAESASTFAGITLSNPDRVLYPEQGVTKRDLAAYYQTVADWILPHVAERPLSLVRCPRGRTGKCFYQKHVSDSAPDAIHGVEIKEEKGTGIYVMVRDLPGLIALVQLGVLEMHPWGARADRIERPDRLVMDLDPGPGVGWKTLQEAAIEARGVFEELGLESWLRTSGGKGLHVVVPFERRISWDDLKAFARGISQLLARRNPSRYVATMSKAKRRGKIYVDYLRNSRGATAIASYSTRARPGAPVATPLRWKELTGVDDPGAFDVNSIPPRLASLTSDPWKGFFETRQAITKRMMKAVNGEG